MSDAKKLADLRRLAAEDSGATDAERETAKKFIVRLEERGVIAEPEHIPPPFVEDNVWYHYPTAHESATEILNAMLGDLFEFMMDDKRWDEFAKKHGVESMSGAPPKKKPKPRVKK